MLIITLDLIKKFQSCYFSLQGLDLLICHSGIGNVVPILKDLHFQVKSKTYVFRFFGGLAIRGHVGGWHGLADLRRLARIGRCQRRHVDQLRLLSPFPFR